MIDLTSDLRIPESLLDQGVGNLWAFVDCGVREGILVVEVLGEIYDYEIVV